MKPSVWPDWIDHLKAKSANLGGETLADHTWDVLVKMAELYRLRPNLPALVATPNLWHMLFWTVFLHDFGKAARGFQGMLSGRGRWEHRHEVLSLAFVPWIASGLTSDELNAISAAIVSHHRDQETIAKKYDKVDDEDSLDVLLAELDPDDLPLLWRWLHECMVPWIAALGLDSVVRPLALMPQAQAVLLVQRQCIRQIRQQLSRYHRLVRYDLPLQSQQIKLLHVLLRGLTTSADHMASAHLKEMPTPLHEAWDALAARIRELSTPEIAANEAYQHQRDAATMSTKSAILMAPTGSGKTEAALYWAVGNGAQPVPRLFYALPYQASMNAMFDRLRHDTTGFGSDAVGLQHGKALQALYLRLLDQETNPAVAAARAGWQKNINTLNARPLKVFSPYQALKALFQIRGFEALFTDYAQAAFIFDEIHAYEPGRLALILVLIEYLRQHFGARFFVMSATFPRLIRERLQQVLDSPSLIQADTELFQRFRRHRLHLLDGELPGGVAQIIAEYHAGRQVLVAANTVRRAQEMRQLLRQAGVPSSDIVLIHSRFTMRDRSRLEADVMDRCRLGTAAPQPFILIATQVIEVSLNIDLDVIYSEPAPLEALLQRFGRINRSRKKGICPVYVFREPTDGQGVYGRSSDKSISGHIVRVTLAELEDHDTHEIDESAINDWLDRIYSDPVLLAGWQAEFDRIADQARTFLQGLCAYNSSDTGEEQFEALFDNVEVLPQCFEAEYLDYLSNGEFLESSQLLVGINAQRYQIFRRKGWIRPAASDTDRKQWVVRLPYTATDGLHFDPDISIEEDS